MGKIKYGLNQSHVNAITECNTEQNDSLLT